MKKVRIGVLIGTAVALMAVVTILSFTGLLAGASKYGTFADARGSKNIHVVGKWVDRDLSNYDAQSDLFSFYMEDSTGHKELVHYMDPMPANFDAAEKVVVEGNYDHDVFLADRIIMKCPSKFNDQSMTTPTAEKRGN